MSLWGTTPSRPTWLLDDDIKKWCKGKKAITKEQVKLTVEGLRAGGVSPKVKAKGAATTMTMTMTHSGEVPHPSNEGLALQARVSGPWPHKKESDLLVELARWQGAQVQTVKRQNVVQRYLK